jgi:hypothetical protein
VAKPQAASMLVKGLVGKVPEGVKPGWEVALGEKPGVSPGGSCSGGDLDL